jgi:hypothetical protein
MTTNHVNEHVKEHAEVNSSMAIITGMSKCASLHCSGRWIRIVGFLAKMRRARVLLIRHRAYVVVRELGDRKVYIPYGNRTTKWETLVMASEILYQHLVDFDLIVAEISPYLSGYHKQFSQIRSEST